MATRAGAGDIVDQHYCENSPRLQILHRTISGIKLDRTIVVRSKLAHLIRLGKTRTLLREKKPGRVTVPVEVTGSKDPLPTTMDEGYREIKL